MTFSPKVSKTFIFLGKTTKITPTPRCPWKVNKREWNEKERKTTKFLYDFSFSFGENAIRNREVNPADKITKPDIIGVLQESEVSFLMNKKADLKCKFDDEMIGIHHVPAVLYNSGQKDESKAGLESYKIFPVEPLHTIAGHIKNLYEEIPSHLNKEQNLKTID